MYIPTISLCMIVCNEEANIRRCLESARGFADETIIVDTGSTDRTKSICEEYGARIFDYKWTDDFSGARNYSVSKASCDWILLLDADEELEIRDISRLKKYLQDIAYDIVPIRMTHFYGDKTPDEKRSNFSDGLRLVRNDGAIRFTGKIHERIDTEGKTAGRAADSRKLARILHYGYMSNASKNKKGRNISLLLKEKNKQADDPWLSYYIAAEYYKSGKFAEALGEVNTAIALFLQKKLMPPSLVYKLKYDMLITSRYYDAAYNGIESAVALYPDYTDLHFYKGLLQYARKEYGKARNTFIYCLILGETTTEHLVLSGSGTFLALYYLGLCHEKQGESEQAAEAFRQAESLYPGLDSFKQELENLEIYL